MWLKNSFLKSDDFVVGGSVQIQFSGNRNVKADITEWKSYCRVQKNAVIGLPNPESLKYVFCSNMKLKKIVKYRGSFSCNSSQNRSLKLTIA